MKQLFILLCAIGYNLIVVGQTCPIDEQLKLIKEQKLSEKTKSVYKTKNSFIVEVTDIPVATFALLCDVYHKDFEKWKKNNPNAETYSMFSFGYDDNNNIARITMYYRVLHSNITNEYLEQLNQEFQNEVLIALNKTKAIQLMNNGSFDTRGLDDNDILEYNPSLYYCGTGAVSDPNQRGWLERNVVPQQANIACFIHDKQYLILRFDKGLADGILKKNAYIELIQKGYNKQLAKQMSNTYYYGVNTFAYEAYRRAQNEAKETQK
ncbi:MAG: hypothetical protein LBM25_01705 [Bacteroidales bacterium]|jgi:hypothetical protein|nr:hypothetical protein [Bacteroidales bacterium]